MAAHLEGLDSCPGQALRIAGWPLASTHGPCREQSGWVSLATSSTPTPPQHKLHGLSVPPVFPCHLVLVLGSGLSPPPSEALGPNAAPGACGRVAGTFGLRGVATEKPTWGVRLRERSDLCQVPRVETRSRDSLEGQPRAGPRPQPHTAGDSGTGLPLSPLSEGPFLLSPRPQALCTSRCSPRALAACSPCLVASCERSLSECSLVCHHVWAGWVSQGCESEVAASRQTGSPRWRTAPAWILG